MDKLEKKQTATREINMGDLMPIIKDGLDRGQTVRFSPQGISMLPMLRQGIDSVVISQAPSKLKKYDLPLYQREDGKFILHRVVEVGQTYTCIGDNQLHAEKGIEHRQIIALVTAFYRGERLIKTSSHIYKIYCRVWHHSRPLRKLWRRGAEWLRRRLK